MSKHKNEKPQYEQVLARIGLTRRMAPSKFSKRIVQQFGAVGAALISHVDKRAQGDCESDFWEKKNADLSLSLAFSSQFFGDFYRSYLPWLLSLLEQKRVTQILDLGCDNGVLACCYAMCIPDVQVLGIDQGPAGIKCSSELAERLQLKNVVFKKVDISELGNALSGKTFDLVTATLVYHCVKAVPNMPTGFSLRDVELPDTAPWSRILESISPLLSEGGLFLSAERLTSTQGVLWWARALNEANLKVEWPLSRQLDERADGEVNRVPAFVCVRGRTMPADLADHVLTFVAHPDLVKLAGSPLYGDAAEALFEAFQSRELIWGQQVRAADDVTLRFELWDARTVILAYQFSNAGYRRLVIAPRDKDKECIHDVKNAWQGQYSRKIFEYSSIQERDSKSGLIGL